MDGILKKWVTFVHIYKINVHIRIIFHLVKLQMVFFFFEWDCPIVECRMTSEVHVKSEKFKSKLQQCFVTVLSFVHNLLYLKQ